MSTNRSTILCFLGPCGKQVKMKIVNDCRYSFKDITGICQLEIIKNSGEFRVISQKKNCTGKPFFLASYK